MGIQGWSLGSQSLDTVWASRDGVWEAKAHLVLDLVRDVDVHKSMGADGLHPRVLREPLQGHC